MDNSRIDIADLEPTLQELLKLSPEERIELGERLIASVPFFPDEESEEALAEVVTRRLREIEEGTVTPVPSEEVHRKILQKMAERRQKRSE